MSNKIISGVYKIESKDGKVYIGSAVNLRKRMLEHFNKLKLGIHNNIHLQRAYNKYGKDHFTFFVLEETEKDRVLSYEQIWINIVLSSLDRDDVYNISPIAGNTTGRKHSEETKAKIAAKAKGRKRSLEECQAMSERRKGNTYAKGYKHSKETRMKITLSQLGKKHTEETKQKMSESAKRRYAK